MFTLIKNIRNKMKEEKGATIMVAYIFFLPIFLIALVMLFELTKIQSLKNINECITDIAANAATRQIDYSNMDVNVRLNSYLPAPVIPYANLTIWGVDPNPASAQYSSYWASATEIERIEAVFAETTSNGAGKFTLGKYDSLTAESIAAALYTNNATNNGLNSTVNRTAISSDNGDFRVQINNNFSQRYDDPILPDPIMVYQPSVFVVTRVKYQVNPMLAFVSTGQINRIYIGSSAVSQLVTSPSSNTDRQQ